VDPAHIETNIVYANVTGAAPAGLVSALRERGVLANGMDNWVRFVTHYGINAEDVDEALDGIEATMKAVRTKV
jgi:threonine aldolase